MASSQGCASHLPKSIGFTMEQPRSSLSHAPLLEGLGTAGIVVTNVRAVDGVHLTNVNVRGLRTFAALCTQSRRLTASLAYGGQLKLSRTGASRFFPLHSGRRAGFSPCTSHNKGIRSHIARLWRVRLVSLMPSLMITVSPGRSCAKGSVWIPGVRWTPGIRPRS
jgi:hypothetical protein